MEPLTISAQFAAFVWFTEHQENPDNGTDQAMQFARNHWEQFLPLAHKGLGRLLLKMAKPRSVRRRAACPNLAVHALATAQEQPARRAALPQPTPQRPFSRN